MFFKKMRLSPPIFLAVALCVFPGLAQAGTLDSGAQKLSLLSRLWEEAQSTSQMLWSTFSGVWEKSGVSIDPNGLPGTSTGTQGGASIDPSGGPTDEGGSIDPNGKP